jgi:methionine-rich copper-binding protein CopC
MVTEHSFSSSMSEMIEELNFEKIMEKAKLECSRVQSDKENSRIVVDENVPVQDGDHEDSYCMRRADQNRGVKRRPTSACSETPLSTLGKCHRSKSPSYKRDLETAAAAKLKPQIVDDVFKMPRPYDSTLKGGTSSSTTTTREYLTAMESLSIRSPGEKLSLPNYALTRSAHKSPTSSNHSKISHWSPNSSEGKLKRSASQLSTASEFQDDFLPIKIKNSDNRKLSFPSVKVDRSEMKTFSIQNGSDKKLPLRVRIIGAGFSVSPKEDFRMVPLEARTFYVKFSPCVVGPVCGRLIFELTTNKHCAKTIPLYGYGGHSSVQMEGIQKGPFGPPFLTMGTIRDLGMTVEKTIRLSNTGTLPSFVSLAFERTKLSDFVMADSLTMHPMQLRIDPDKFADVKIRFRATKADVRKIVSSNKDVTTIGEIFMISGDEPTRLRILMNKGQVEQKLLSCLPKSLPNEADLQAKLIKFNEDLSKDKLLNIISQIKTHEIALTVNRNLDDTQLLSTEISLADDTQMNFETFIDTNYTRVFSSDGCHTLVDHDNVE